MTNAANIKIRHQDPTTTVTFEAQSVQHKEIECIAQTHNVSVEEIFRALLEYSLDAYRSGKVLRIWPDGSQEMEKFRSGLQVGETVIAGGMVGKLVTLDELFVTLEVAKGVVVRVLREAVTDVISVDAP
jgi:hypothetical protein